MSYVLDGKGNIYRNNKIVWAGNPATVVRLLEDIDSMERELAHLRADNERLRGLVETGKEAAQQALTLYFENQGLRDELRKSDSHA